MEFKVGDRVRRIDGPHLHLKATVVEEENCLGQTRIRIKFDRDSDF